MSRPYASRNAKDLPTRSSYTAFWTETADGTVVNLPMRRPVSIGSSPSLVTDLGLVLEPMDYDVDAGLTSNEALTIVDAIV